MDGATTDCVPTIIVCGFLGAGKTTLLRRLLSDPQGIRYGVLLNDFGAIDIDGALLAQAGADRLVLNNGCICCAVGDELTDALERLLDGSPVPERIVIETSGVSRPLPVADALAAERFRDRVQLDGIYCVVDAAGFGELDFAATELAIDQAVGADLVVLNKVDVAGPAALEAAEASLRAAMPKLRLLATERAAVPRDVLFAGRAGGAHHHHDHHHHGHDHDDDWEVWHWRSPAPVAASALRRALRSLPPGVLRAKGVAPGAPGERLVFHAVGKRAEVTAEPGEADESAVVAIGRRGAFDPAALTALFDACVTAGQTR